MCIYIYIVIVDNYSRWNGTYRPTYLPIKSSSVTVVVSGYSSDIHSCSRLIKGEEKVERTDR